jgi:uncharacterized damage-inducible protein DinB
MKVARGFTLAVLVITVTGGTSAEQAPAAGQEISFALGLQRSYAGIKRNLTEAAEKMPASDYDHTPSPEIRSYAGQLGHVAFWNYEFCSTARGEPNPNQEDFENTRTAKPDVVKALAESFAYCDSAFAEATDASALQLVPRGQNEVARGSMLVSVIRHGNEEYGIITVYLRTKNLVPPSTERARTR